ncbi:MAG: RcpC/CpaB family pilus assembly protein [Planctomycetaceae bacterium]|nr:RcpC/CpaB family pilus assembly protein [Planctomycetaceae bacterium]
MVNERTTTAKADAPSGIRNTRLLLVAGGLGVAVVILYLAQISHIREENQQGKVELLVFTHDIKAGATISESDVERVQVERSQIGRMGDLVLARDFPQFSGQPAAEEIKQKQYVQYRHFNASAKDRPATKLSEGMVAFPLEVDPRFVPGDVLRVYDRVLVMAVIMGEDRRARTYQVFKGGVRVIAVGGKGEQVRELRSGTERVGQVASSYRTITIEVPAKELPELVNLMTHIIGSVRLAMPYADAPKAQDDASINPQLMKLAGNAEYRSIGG